MSWSDKVGCNTVSIAESLVTWFLCVETIMEDKFVDVSCDVDFVLLAGAFHDGCNVADVANKLESWSIQWHDAGNNWTACVNTNDEINFCVHLIR